MVFAGIDVGSRTTKAVILGPGGQILSRGLRETGVHGKRVAEELYTTCLNRAEIDCADVGRVVSTGYGKQGVSFAGAQVSEISCHARGVFHLFPSARTVIDIGGQDSKVIVLGQEGAVGGFAMNDRCAAGTGRFLEFMSRVLEMELDQMAATPHDPLRTRAVSSLCTVFAESEVISLLSEGCSVKDIVRGLHAAVAERTAALLKRVPFLPPVTMAGGVARNRGVVKALEERLGLSLQVPEEPQLVGAIGAACLARSRFLKGSQEASAGPWGPEG